MYLYLYLHEFMNCEFVDMCKLYPNKTAYYHFSVGISYHLKACPTTSLACALQNKMN